MTASSSSAAPDTGQGFPARLVLAWVVVALVVRVIHLCALARTPFFHGLVVDAQAYALDANAILSDGTIRAGFYRPPLYAYIRAGLTWVGLGGPWTLGIVHALVGSASVGMLATVTFRLASEHSPQRRRLSTGIAAALAALYGPLVVFDVEMLPSVWVNALIACGYLAATSRRAAPGIDAIGGASMGFATIGWPPAALLALPVWWLRRNVSNRSLGAQRRATWIFVAAMASGPAMTALHNAHHDAGGVVVSANLGINLWLGNAPRWRETMAARPGIRYDLEYRRPTQAGALSMPAREAYYIDLVARRVLQAPLSAAAATAEKFYLFWYGREIRRDPEWAWLRHTSWIAACSIWEWGIKFPFGLLVPLALACPACALRWQTKWVVLAGATFYASVLSCFILGARYRLPVVLLLIPLGACGIASVLARTRLDDLGAQHGRRYAARAGVFVAALVVLNLPNAYSKTFTASEAELRLLEGQAYAAQHDLERALRETRRAIRQAPDDPDARVQLGRLLMRTGRPRQAAQQLRAAGELVPESEDPWVLHGHAMIMLGQYADAIYNFQEALKRNPYQREALRDLGTCYALSGRPELAIAAHRRYLDAGYHDDRTALYLARALLQDKQTAAALEILTALQARYPSWPQLRRLMTQARSQPD